MLHKNSCSPCAGTCNDLYESTTQGNVSPGVQLPWGSHFPLPLRQERALFQRTGWHVAESADKRGDARAVFTDIGLSR